MNFGGGIFFATDLITLRFISNGNMKSILFWRSSSFSAGFPFHFALYHYTNWSPKLRDLKTSNRRCCLLLHYLDALRSKSALIKSLKASMGRMSCNREFLSAMEAAFIRCIKSETLKKQCQRSKLRLVSEKREEIRKFSGKTRKGNLDLLKKTNEERYKHSNFDEHNMLSFL